MHFLYYWVLFGLVGCGDCGGHGDLAVSTVIVPVVGFLVDKWYYCVVSGWVVDFLYSYDGFVHRGVDQSGVLLLLHFLYGNGTRRPRLCYNLPRGHNDSIILPSNQNRRSLLRNLRVLPLQKSFSHFDGLLENCTAGVGLWESGKKLGDRLLDLCRADFSSGFVGVQYFHFL